MWLTIVFTVSFRLCLIFRHEPFSSLRRKLITKEEEEINDDIFQFRFLSGKTLLEKRSFRWKNKIA